MKWPSLVRARLRLARKLVGRHTLGVNVTVEDGGFYDEGDKAAFYYGCTIRNSREASRYKRVPPNHDLGDPRAVAEWYPIDTYPEGIRAIFWMPNGEKGNGVMEYGMAFRDDDGVIRHGWTDGGPNSGSDFQFFEPPTKWCYRTEDPPQ